MTEAKTKKIDPVSQFVPGNFASSTFKREAAWDNAGNTGKHGLLVSILKENNVGIPIAINHREGITKRGVVNVDGSQTIREAATKLLDVFSNDDKRTREIFDSNYNNIVKKSKSTEPFSISPILSFNHRDQGVGAGPVAMKYKR